MKTAVEWLVEKLELDMYQDLDDNTIKIIDQAKEMEKQQVIDAYQTSHISMMTAEQYYNETFKSE